MLKKKILAIMLAVVMVLLTACGSNQKEEEKDWLAKQTGVEKYEFGEEKSKDALRILLDMSTIRTTQDLFEFSQQLEKHYGLTDVTFEHIPTSGAEREMIVERLKVELMAGDGPDVYIIESTGVYSGEEYHPLFPYPEKVMENGLFLPLDDYMENHSKLTDWSKQQQTVLAAGRNEEGQQIIPLSYSFPVLCYPQSTVQVEKPDELLSWQDIIADPDAVSLYGGLIDCGAMTEYGPGTWPYFNYVLGKTADYVEEELLFTEEELLQRLKEINSLPILEDPEETVWYDVEISDPRANKDYPLTMLPLYSDDGGIAASIEAFAVVNRNTRRPDDAYAVIDVLMSEYMQQKSSLYGIGLCSSGLPLNEDLYTEEKPLHARGSMIAVNYAELVDMREQITAAYYPDILSTDLHTLLMRSRNPEAYGKTTEELVHETYEQTQRKVRE